MTTSQAGAAARQAAGNPWIDRLARVGLAARGTVYLVVGVIALQIAFGHGGGKRADQSGAFQTILDKPFGKTLLWLIVIGFLGYAVWLATDAIWGQPGGSGGKTAERVKSAVKAVLYVGLAVLAGRVATGGSGGSGGAKPAASALGEPGGRWLVGLAGLVVLVVGCFLVYEGLKAKFEEKLRTGSIDPTVRRNAVRLGRVGYTARGVVIVLVGVLVIEAAWTSKPQKAKGFDVALKEVATQPFGPWLLTAVALGLACFGAFSLFEARYREL